MKPFLAGLTLLALALLSGCATGPKLPPPPLILISLDGFRADYRALHPAETATLNELARTGASARALIPVYPSNTFPNHYSIVTGLYPSHHGIVNNHFFDAASGTFFHSSQTSIVVQPQWWGGEPIWVTAMKQGGKGACWFWPGSEAEIQGVRPLFWRRWDPEVPFETRLAELTRWLKDSAGPQPTIATFYLEETNAVGHKRGPDSPEMVASLKQADDRIARLLAEVKAAGVDANYVFVADHGMTNISTERIILLDDFINSADVQLDFDGPVAGLRPNDGNVDSLLRKLAPLKHARAYRTADLPARFHVSPSPRNPDVWIVPDEGWEIYFRTQFEKFRANFNRGDHGFDPAFPTMHATFIVHGPSFRRDGAVIDPVENIHLYNLLCAALQLKPAANDGDQRLVRKLLRR